MLQTSYTTLLAVVDEIEADREAGARALLTEAVEARLGSAGEDLQACLFASALSARFASGSRASRSLNLYLQQLERSQISLFDLLARHLPTVAWAGALANDVLAGFLARHDEVTLLDVGIGSGRQEVALVRLLAERGQLPRRMDVIAVEPDASSLRSAGGALDAAAHAAGLQLGFRPVRGTVEDLSADDWARFSAVDTPIVVLGAFALHHVRPGPSRDVLFHRLASLAPEVVVLCEPSSDHDAPSLRERFAASWRHFGLTFRIIDGLDIPEAEKNSMKLFFAREIEDIVSAAEDARCERHQPAETWVARLREAGLTPMRDFGRVRVPEGGTVRVAPRDGYLSLEAEDETLVAVICATTEG
jgi:hypothetical protein